MKFRKYFVYVFLLSFLIGCMSVLFSTKEKSSLIKETGKVVSPITENITVAGNPPKQVKKPFTPQIFNLKDFSGDIVLPKYKFKMVDLSAHGNSYRKDEVVAKTGETWLGFFINDNNSYLKNTKVKIILENEKVFGDQDWVSIKLKEKKQPSFLLKNAKKLKEGKVITLLKVKSSEEEIYDDSNTMYRGFFRDFQFGGRKYSLRVKDALTKSGDTVLALLLETETISQVVTYGPYFDGDYLGNLLWVGDLEGDNKLDFYMNFNSYEKGSFSSSLFLSSEAEKGKLVKEVADFGTAGC